METTTMLMVLKEIKVWKNKFVHLGNKVFPGVIHIQLSPNYFLFNNKNVSNYSALWIIENHL